MHTRSRLAAASRIDALEPRRLFSLVNGNGTSTVTGSDDYQSIDATVALPGGGTVVAGTFGENTKFGNGLPSVAPRGATDLFISVVKGSSASLLTIGGGSGNNGKLRFKGDRADYTGIPERVDDGDYFFPLDGRAARTDEYVTKMAVGPDGKLYVAIAFRREISLNTRDKKATTLTAQKEFDDNQFDSAVLRYTIDGANLKLDRTLQIGGPFNDIIFDLDFAKNGDLLVAGSFERRCDFDPTGGKEILNPDGRNDAFVARYGSKNKLEWVRQFGGDSSQTRELEATYGIAVSGGSVYAGGAFASDAEFDRRDRLNEDGQDDGQKRVRIDAQKLTDGFTLKLDIDDGSLDWVRAQGGDDFDAVRDVAVAPDGGVYNLGFFQNEANLDTRSGHEQIFNAADQGDVTSSRGEDTDLFFTRLSARGNLDWVKPLGGEAVELIGSLTSSANGDLTIAGSFAGTIDVNPSKAKKHLTSTKTDMDDRNGNRDYAFAGFVATYSSKGVYRRSSQINAQREQDLIVNDATLTSDGKALVAGRYLGGFTVENVRTTTQKKPEGREDGFAASFFVGGNAD